MIVKKRQHRLAEVDEVVLSLSGRLDDRGDLGALHRGLWASVSRETISKITDQVLEEMTAWMNRPLDEVCLAS